jgi:nitrile hydratase
MSGHDHHHDHDHSELTETQLRVRALETVLTEKGYVDPAALDLLIETYEKKVGPRNGARVVAKAWADPAYRARLFKDATPTIAELGYAGRQGASTSSRWRTRRRGTTWSCARCARVIRGRCSACRQSGTSRRPTARARCPIRAACSRISA